MSNNIGWFYGFYFFYGSKDIDTVKFA